MTTTPNKQNTDDIIIPRKQFLLFAWLALLLFVIFTINKGIQASKNRKSYEKMEEKKLEFEKQKWKEQQQNNEN